MIKIVSLRPFHVRVVLEQNEREGIILPMSGEDMIASYLSPGSLAVTMVADGIPVACGGIINVGWSRGEAWILTSSQSWFYRKSMVKEMKSRISELASQGGFHRVQATCFTPGREKFFRLLGFDLETEKGLAGYGPSGETAFMFARCYR
jgi:hypothetical protein